jgi:hypothetical protein
VAHDSQEPRPCIVAVQRADVFECAQASLLYHILGVVGIARQPTRQIVRGVEVRQDQLFETVYVRQADAPRLAVYTAIGPFYSCGKRSEDKDRTWGKTGNTEYALALFPTT